MRNFAALAILAAFAHCALGAEDFAFTYRGCINGTPIPSNVDVQFALYDRATGGAALWTATNSVMPATNGFFQCELAGDGLAAAFTNANARYLGVSIGGEAEQYPRQEVFAAPLVDHAKCAASLAPNGNAESVLVTNLSAKTMSLGKLDLHGNLAFKKSGTSLTLTYVRNLDGATLTMKKGGEVSLLKPAAPLKYTFDSIAVNRAMFNTTSGGLVTVMSTSRDNWDGEDGMPCVTWAVSPGYIHPPVNVNHPVTVYFYPFGAAN